MHTIAFVSRKGGTGKSTLAIGLGVAAMEVGHKVCLLEADPLGTISNWRRRRSSPEPLVESIHDGYALFHCVQALAQRGITLTIVDTAGGWSDASTGAMAAADLCGCREKSTCVLRRELLQALLTTLSSKCVAVLDFRCLCRP
jgi:chromosome partitioning protein